MKIRVKFKKFGVMKFIGHLDVMRYFQKAMRRAKIDVCFSGGYNPHMIMSFASPLGVGITSDGEYLDMEINDVIPSKEALERLNAAMVEGIEVVSFKSLSDQSKNAMSIVAAADYEVSFRDNYEPDGNWKSMLSSFYEQESIVVLKKTKKSEKEVDIRPFLYQCFVIENRIFLQLAAGSVVNIKPELVMEAFFDFMQHELPPFALMIHRKELYGHLPEKNQELVTLEEMGEDIA